MSEIKNENTSSLEKFVLEQEKFSKELEYAERKYKSAKEDFDIACNLDENDPDRKYVIDIASKEMSDCADKTASIRKRIYNSRCRNVHEITVRDLFKLIQSEKVKVI